MFQKEDEAYVVGLKEILQEGKFELTGLTAPSFVKVLIWVNKLEDKIKQDLLPKPEVKLKPKKKAKT